MIHRVRCSKVCTGSSNRSGQSGSAHSCSCCLEAEVTAQRGPRPSVMRISCSHDRPLLRHWVSQQMCSDLREMAKLAASGQSAAAAACQLDSQ